MIRLTCLHMSVIWEITQPTLSFTSVNLPTHLAGLHVSNHPLSFPLYLLNSFLPPFISPANFLLPFPDNLSPHLFFISLFSSTYFCLLFMYSNLISPCKTNGHTKAPKENTPVQNAKTQCNVSLPNVEQVDSNRLQRMTCRSNKHKRSSYFIFQDACNSTSVVPNNGIAFQPIEQTPRLRRWKHCTFSSCADELQRAMLCIKFLRENLSIAYF